MAFLQFVQRNQRSLLVEIGVMFPLGLCHQPFNGDILGHEILLVRAFSPFWKGDWLHGQKLRLFMADQENALLFRGQIFQRFHFPGQLLFNGLQPLYFLADACQLFLHAGDCVVSGPLLHKGADFV